MKDRQLDVLLHVIYHLVSRLLDGKDDSIGKRYGRWHVVIHSHTVILALFNLDHLYQSSHGSMSFRAAAKNKIRPR